jgi:hypothetical protein
MTASQNRGLEKAGWKWRRHAIPILLLWLLALMAYSNSFKGLFIFDNDTAIVQDSRVWSATAGNLKALATGDYWYTDRTSGLYRPLTKISY